MSSIFKKEFEVGWRDIDLNGHMANFTYLTYAVSTRIAFFASCGFSPGEFQRIGFGPVIKSDLTEYFRELKMLELFTVTIENGGTSNDLSRFRVINNFYKQDGTHAARVTSIGGWLSLTERKLIAAPDTLKNAWETLKLTADHEVLPSSIKA